MNISRILIHSQDAFWGATYRTNDDVRAVVCGDLIKLLTGSMPKRVLVQLSTKRRDDAVPFTLISFRSPYLNQVNVEWKCRRLRMGDHTLFKHCADILQQEIPALRNPPVPNMAGGRHGFPSIWVGGGPVQTSLVGCRRPGAERLDAVTQDRGISKAPAQLLSGVPVQDAIYGVVVGWRTHGRLHSCSV